MAWRFTGTGLDGWFLYIHIYSLDSRSGANTRDPGLGGHFPLLTFCCMLALVSGAIVSN